MAWTATLRPNPSDPHPVAFTWDGDLACSDPTMLRAVTNLADELGQVSQTPTGPFLPTDLHIGYVAFSVVYLLAVRAGLFPVEVEVEGDGWQWPALSPAITDAVY